MACLSRASGRRSRGEGVSRGIVCGRTETSFGGGGGVRHPPHPPTPRQKGRTYCGCWEAPPRSRLWRWTSLGPNAIAGDSQSPRWQGMYTGPGQWPQKPPLCEDQPQGQSGGSAGTTRVYADSTRASNNSGERLLGAASYRQSNTRASCHTTRPPWTPQPIPMVNRGEQPNWARLWPLGPLLLLCICGAWSKKMDSPVLCLSKLLRMKQVTQKYPQHLKKKTIAKPPPPPPPPPNPPPHTTGGLGPELKCTAPHPMAYGVWDAA